MEIVTATAAFVVVIIETEFWSTVLVVVRTVEVATKLDIEAIMFVLVELAALAMVEVLALSTLLMVLMVLEEMSVLVLTTLALLANTVLGC
ncbi:hypothetical protein BCR33DRAFT_428470 [Rhizoclosmatium globosum]|uniref:Uncharacterized protein n=1 Tax=Rhizoclosmatium globosum TaxID=329046 RepID=A0A1Y2BU96_9FUNG|nr:hypothetical protein BCR33DRAFT_428470 [Rhizoclosmatium globosum]|eukprot:ORY38326.1 hypothetical protein BCR33DRAFT_428470 [Rhizoclosmatium globosum]